MKTTKTIVAGLMLAAGFLCSCQSDLDESAKGYGYLQLSSVDVNKTMTRADVTATEQISVDVYDEENTLIEHADKWQNINTEGGLLLPAGKTYTVKAYSYDRDKNAQGFDAKPYYAGEKDVTIQADKANYAEITCKLAQSKVSVEYTDKFKSAFTEPFQCYVTGNSGTSIEFKEGETRAAYVKAEQPLSIKLDFGNDKVFTQQITASAEAAHLYKVTLEAGDAQTGITITLDQTIHQYEVTLEIPTKMEDYIATTDISSDASKVWGQFAYLVGECNITGATDPVQFCYKKTTDADWTTIEATKAGDTFTYENKVAPLDFGTEYEYYIKCGDKQGETVSFTTEAFIKPENGGISNLNFDTWSKTEKGLFTKRDCWYPNSDQTNSYWATGNEGVITLKSSNTIPVEGEDAHNGKAAKLTTIEISLVGYAAGNLFIGNYSTNMEEPASSVSFGRPYSGARPVKLSGWYKYQPGAAMRTDEGATVPSDRKLTSDECDIYVILWSGNTKIAESHFINNQTVSSYKNFELPIEYSNTSLRPDKIAIVATSSRYGGEFSGTSVVGQLAVGSTLWVDEFELSYY